MSLNQNLQEKYPHLELSVLKLSEVKKDNESFRIDSEFFKKEYFNAIKTMQLNKIEYLGNNVKLNSRYSQPKYDEMSNIKVINSQYIRNEYIDYENAKYGYGKIVPKEAILINSTGVGTLGRVFINMLDFNFSIDSHINVILVKDEIYLNPYFLTIFLQSYYGQIQVTRYYSGTSGQIEIYSKDFSYFKIPILPMSFQQEIEKMVKDSHKALEESKALYKKAEETLYLELGLDPLDPLKSIETKNQKNLNISIRSLKESFLKTGRLDSEYYQEKYEEIEFYIKNYSGGYCRLGDIGIFNNGSFISESLYTTEARRAYIRIKELSFDAPIKTQECIFIDDNFIATNETIVKKGDFIIAIIGNTIGKVNLIPQELEGSFISNNTTRFRLFHKVNLEFMELLLRSVFVQEQMQREFTQTAQPKISNQSLKNILIPKIDFKIQEKISKYIEESFSLRKKSKELLDNAKIKVEQEIENLRN
ncbi:restriction endonuclease subunit S [Campylobacter taeniopygiae]|uniref:restriction endonuclease subunit S n=1 Tax=Campylobacter taeniopygiae TaxID=2510188 RepID=UPI003D6B962B